MVWQLRNSRNSWGIPKASPRRSGLFAWHAAWRCEGAFQCHRANRQLGRSSATFTLVVRDEETRTPGKCGNDPSASRAETHQLHRLPRPRKDVDTAMVSSEIRHRLQNSGHGENIHAIGAGRGHRHSCRTELYRCRSTACRITNRIVKASRGHRLHRPSSQHCSHVALHLQHSICAKTVARHQTWLTSEPPMPRVLDS